MFVAAIDGADIVTLFLMPHVNRWLEVKLRRELAPGARGAGFAFAMPTWAQAAMEEHERQATFLWIR